MRIVHCFFTFEMGGAQVLAVDLLNRMCHEHQTALVVVNDICSEPLLQKLDKRVAVHRIRRPEGGRNPWPLVKFNLLLRRLKPDIVHCHEPDIGRIIRARVGKLIYTIHDTGIPTTFYHYFSSLVAISDAVRAELAPRFDRPVRTVYNGIEAAAFARRQHYRIGPGEPLKLIQLSRLMHEKKGQDVLLRALYLLKNQFGYPHFSLDVVGSGGSLAYLQQLTAEWGLSGEVNFVGERNRDWLYAHLAEYHLLVQPSRYEGFGLTILEGFAAGLPVLASDIEGPAEIIGRTARGFLFPNGDSAACAQELQRLFQDYETGAMEQLMQNSEPVTDREYAIGACAAGYLREYQALLA